MSLRLFGNRFLKNRMQKVLYNPVSLFGTAYSDKDALQTQVVPDILFNSLKNASSTKNVFESVLRHHKVMNSKHVMQALRSLFLLQKEGRSEVSAKQLIKHKEFERLCYNLKKHSGVIDIHETIEALKIISFVGIPSNSTIIQVLLQLIRHNINNLSLANVMFLEFLLGRYTSTPLVDALKIALPIVFEINLPLKMDRENINILTEYLYFASKNNLSQKTIDLILEALLNCPQTYSNVKMAKSIVWSLADLNPSPSFEPLLQKNINEITLNFDELSDSELESTLSKLSSAYSKENPHFYNKVFCDTYVDYIIEKNLGYQQSIFTMRKLKKLNHTSKSLMDYISEKIQEDPQRLAMTETFDIYNLLVYITRLPFEPKYWSIIKTKLEGLPLSENPRGVNLLKLNAALCSLGIFKENLLQKCFHDNLYIKLSRRKNLIYSFLAIYHSFKLFKPSLIEFIPKDLHPEKLVGLFPAIEEFPLEDSLKLTYGGEKYVKSGIYTKDGHQIDHLIVFRMGGHPVSFSCNSQFIEDMEICSDNQKVLILNLKPAAYTFNDKHLRLNIEHSIKVLENSNYIVVPICFESWENLAEYEKIPYLVQAINCKLESKHLSNNILN